MFDGTDLSLVYGDNMLEPPQIQPSVANKNQQQNIIRQAQTPPDIDYQPSEVIHTPQQPPPKITYEPSFWDKLILRKNEVFKLVLFSLIILLAISFDKFLCHYLKTYIDENILSWSQEFLVRLSYPILIILIIWIFKAL